MIREPEPYEDFTATYALNVEIEATLQQAHDEHEEYPKIIRSRTYKASVQ